MGIIKQRRIRLGAEETLKQCVSKREHLENVQSCSCALEMKPRSFETSQVATIGTVA